MEILKISQIANSNSQSKNANSTSAAKSEYAKILAEKIASAIDTMKQMNVVQSQLDEINELHKELTGKSTSNDDSKDNGGIESTRTIKRFMPDGSIMITTIKDGEIVEQHKKKPHLVAVADYSAPKTESGQTPLKMESHLDLLSLLM